MSGKMIYNGARIQKERTMEQLQLLSVHKQDYPPLVRDAVAMIETQYAYLYGIDELAALLEVTKHHLIRIFTANTGIPPGKYLADIRVFHAKSMLRSGEDAPLEIIAGACGYSCANYFCKVFKKHTGMTPTDYMKSVQRNDAITVDEAIKKFYL
jgi:transcriptional regulator GlxA family with amidase domain